MTRSPSSRYAGFLALSVAIVAAICAIGFVPTRRLAGPDGVPAMFAGCGVSLIAAALAGVLLVAVTADSPQARMQRSFFAMIARLAVVVALGAAAALSGVFATEPLLFWIGAAYVVLLPLEVRLAL